MEPPDASQRLKRAGFFLKVSFRHERRHVSRQYARDPAAAAAGNYLHLLDPKCCFAFIQLFLRGVKFESPAYTLDRQRLLYSCQPDSAKRNRHYDLRLVRSEMCAGR